MSDLFNSTNKEYREQIQFSSLQAIKKLEDESRLPASQFLTDLTGAMLAQRYPPPASAKAEPAPMKVEPTPAKLEPVRAVEPVRKPEPAPKAAPVAISTNKPAKKTGGWLFGWIGDSSEKKTDAKTVEPAKKREPAKKVEAVKKPEPPPAPAPAPVVVKPAPAPVMKKPAAAPSPAVAKTDKPARKSGGWFFGLFGGSSDKQADIKKPAPVKATPPSPALPPATTNKVDQSAMPR